MEIKKYQTIIWAAVSIVCLGGGIGIGYAIKGDSTTSTTSYVANKKIEAMFSVPRRTPAAVQNAKLEDLYVSGNSGSYKDFVTGLVTDGNGVVNDKSFYEASGKGILDIYGLSGSLVDEEALYRAPADGNSTTITPEYVGLYNSFVASATDKKKVIVVPGFAHPNAIYDFWKANETGYDDLYFLLLDNPPTYSPDADADPENLKHTFSIEFDVSKSGFKAGYLASLYLMTINDANPKVGTWGGGNFPGVTSFMRGFVAGVKYYNDNKEERNPKVEIVKFNDDADYTNTGFDNGGGTTRADYLIDNGADVILPVAGGQTKDLIDAIKRSQRKDEVKIVGVDTDQSVTYSEDKNLFLTSITKNLRKAVYEGYKEITSDSTEIPGTYAPTDQDSTKSFIGDDSQGFSTYTKQFDTSSSSFESAAWKWIYDTVDAAPTTSVFANWADALSYIKSQ